MRKCSQVQGFSNKRHCPLLLPPLLRYRMPCCTSPSKQQEECYNQESNGLLCRALRMIEVVVQDISNTIGPKDPLHYSSQGTLRSREAGKRAFIELHDKSLPLGITGTSKSTSTCMVTGMLGGQTSRD